MKTRRPREATRGARGGGFEVVAQAGDAEELPRSASGGQPDGARADIVTPPTDTDDGLARRQIRRPSKLGRMVPFSTRTGLAHSPLVGDSAEARLPQRTAWGTRRFADSARRVGEGGSRSTSRSSAACLVAVAGTTAPAAPTKRDLEALEWMA